MDNITKITGAVLAVAVAVGVVVLIALGHSVPGELWGAFGTVIGFFFGAQVPVQSK